MGHRQKGGNAVADPAAEQSAQIELPHPAQVVHAAAHGKGKRLTARVVPAMMEASHCSPAPKAAAAAKKASRMAALSLSRKDARRMGFPPPARNPGAWRRAGRAVAADSMNF